ncbi:MAG: cell division protein SepF [Candidatus Actinomarina sp.]|nr:cell division protein SepF [Candidatus Actinomarina sp.]
MLEKFLIAIGLKQPQQLDVNETIPQNKTVRPSSENLFSNDERVGDVKIHNPKDEVEIKVLKSFNDIHNLGTVVKEDFKVAMDIRDITDQVDRRRIIDFVTGMAFISDAKIRSINKDGVYLILPASSSLPSSERERLQNLGLYRINV